MAITRRIRQPVTMIAVLVLWMTLALQVCNGLSPTLLPSLSSLSSSLSSSTSSSTSSSSLMVSRSLEDLQQSSSRGRGDISRSQQKNREAKTLYDYLGASPKDTQEELKIRYTALVKTLHPDSNPDSADESAYYDLCDINAAWEVLKNPIERKRYDQSLQAKEFTEGIETLVSLGMKSFATTAIPWLQKTADTTVAAVDASTKAAQEVNEQAKSAYGVFELEQQSKVLEQKANADAMRASKIQKELIALPTKKIPNLEKNKQQQQQQQQLSSAEAQRILKSFQITTTTTKLKPPPASLSNEIKILVDTESKHKDALKTCQSTERATQMVARKIEQASKAEEFAQKRLEDAQRAFKEAKQIYAAAQELDTKAKAEQKTSQVATNKFESVLQKSRDKVRAGLLQQQDIFLDRKAKELKKEKEECEKSSKTYRKEAKELRIKAKKVEKEQRKLMP